MRRLRSILFVSAFAALAAFPAGASAAAGDIHNFAGTGVYGYSGDGGLATDARLAGPVGVGIAGQVSYIGDYVRHRVRRVDAGGIISTFAGTGSSGFSGDGGAATSAALHSPGGIAADSAGNVYIADAGNARVRRVGPDGTITTVAGIGAQGYTGDGGAATLARLHTPIGLAIDAAGNLYVSDMGNHTVRRITPDGTISTVAGTGSAGYTSDDIAATSARLHTPRGIGLDRSGNLYIADTYNNRIRRVTPAGIISTFAGTGSNGDSGDGGAATSTQIDDPAGLYVDSADTIFFADEGNRRIRKVTAAGTISLVAGTGARGSAGDGGPATSATLDSPHGVALDADGDLLLADGSISRVRRIEAAAPPAAPTLTATSPASGSNDNTVEVRGATEPGWTVSIYTDSDCTGTVAATGTAAAFASPGITVSVADDSTTTFYATATSTTGATSGCSSSSVTYVEDSTGPSTTIGTSPSTPSDDVSPFWSFSAESGATYACRLTRGATTVSDWSACTSAKSYFADGRAGRHVHVRSAGHGWRRQRRAGRHLRLRARHGGARRPLDRQRSRCRRNRHHADVVVLG